MTIRIASLLIAAVLAGLFWSLGSNVHAVITHCVAPPLFAVAVALLFRPASRWYQLLFLALVLSVAEFVRLVAYSILGDGSHYIRSDNETQLVTLASFGLQCVTALLVWGGVTLVVRRYERRMG